MRCGSETIAHIPGGPHRRERALLIAAAPELLKAALASASELNQVAEEFGHHNVIMDAIACLEEASAKAGGASYD